MAKYNIDDILNELGVEGAGPKEQPPNAPAGGASTPNVPVKRHRVDDAESSFSPVPSVPANQGDIVKAQPGSQASLAPTSAVGPATRDIYVPGPTGSARSETDELADLLLTRGAVTGERLQVALQVIRQSPGRRLPEVLIEQGCDEALVQGAVAELAGVPFERIDLNKGLEGGFDGQILQRLTPEFCKQNGVIPLRMEGQRLVLATTQADNVFLIDEVRQRLGVAGVKLVLTTAFDIKGTLEIIGEGAAQDVNVNDLLSGVEDSDVQVEKKSIEETDLAAASNESPVIRYVNYIIQTAVKEARATSTSSLRRRSSACGSASTASSLR